MAWFEGGTWNAETLERDLATIYAQLALAIQERTVFTNIAVSPAFLGPFDVNDGFLLPKKGGGQNILPTFSPVPEDFDGVPLYDGDASSFPGGNKWVTGRSLGFLTESLLEQMQEVLTNLLDSTDTTTAGVSFENRTSRVRWATTDSDETTRYADITAVLTAGSYGAAWLVTESIVDPKPLLQMREVLDKLIYPVRSTYWTSPALLGKGAGTIQSGADPNIETAWDDAKADTPIPTVGGISGPSWVNVPRSSGDQLADIRKVVISTSVWNTDGLTGALLDSWLYILGRHGIQFRVSGTLSIDVSAEVPGRTFPITVPSGVANTPATWQANFRIRDVLENKSLGSQNNR